MSGNRVPDYPKKLLDTRPSTRDFKSRVIWKPYLKTYLAVEALKMKTVR
jgi:hypothetical protein